MVGRYDTTTREGNGGAKGADAGGDAGRVRDARQRRRLQAAAGGRLAARPQRVRLHAQAALHGRVSTTPANARQHPPTPANTRQHPPVCNRNGDAVEVRIHADSIPVSRRPLCHVTTSENKSICLSIHNRLRFESKSNFI